MFRKSLFTTGLCAASLSIAMLAGCSSPVAVPTTPTEVAGAPAAPAAESPTAPGAQPASPAAPALSSPAAFAPTTLTGKATFRNEALAGYAVSVFDAQTGKPVELKSDLAGVNTLAILNQNLMTDAQGGFSLQVVGLKAGQALRVTVTKGNGSLETIVTSDLRSVGSAKLHLLAEGGDLTINELTTAIAKVARGVLSNTQVLTAEAAAPVLAKLAVEMAQLSAKLQDTLSKNPGLAANLISNENKTADGAVKALVDGAGLLKTLSNTIANLVADVAKAAKVTGNQSAAANDDAVKAALAKVVLVGTNLASGFSNNGFTLTNSVTGQSADASGNLGTVTDTPANGNSSTSWADVYVSSAEALTAAVANPAYLNKVIGLTADIELDDALKISQPLTINGNGKTLNKGVWVNAIGVTLKKLTVTPSTITDVAEVNPVGVFVDRTNATLDTVTINGTPMVSVTYKVISLSVTRGVVTQGDGGVALTVNNSTITNCDTGIFSDYSTTLTATDNTLTGCATGIDSVGSDLTGTVSGNTFSNNDVDIRLDTPVLTGTYPAALKAKLMANNPTASSVNFAGITFIADAAALRTALTAPGSNLFLAEDFEGDGAPFVVARNVTIEGNGASLNAGFEINSGDSATAGTVIKNMTITGQGYLDDTSTDAAIYVSSYYTGTQDPVTFENVTIDYANDAVTNLNAVAFIGSYVVVKDCNFTVANTTDSWMDAGGLRVTGLYATYGKLEITGTTFNGHRGVLVYSDGGGSTEVGALSGNTFNNESFGVHLYGEGSVQEGDSLTDTQAYVLGAGNTFGSALSESTRVKFTTLIPD